MKDLEAIALRYRQEEDPAPVVLAKGQGRLAEAILRLAKEAGIPTINEPELVEMLKGVEIGEYIPPEAYPLAAEIIVFLMRLDEKMAQKKNNYPSRQV